MTRYKLNGAIAAYVPKHPSTLIDLDKLRKAKDLSPIDRVEAYYRSLIVAKEPRFRELMNTVVMFASVEGGVAEDETEAARMVRDAAKAANDIIVGGYKLHEVVLYLRRVATRYQMGRNARLAQAKEALRLSAQAANNSTTEH